MMTRYIKKEDIMTVEKLMGAWTGYPPTFGVLRKDGKYYLFRAEAKHLTEADLIEEIPEYQEKGNHAIEAPAYMYAMYGLTKAEGEPPSPEAWRSAVDAVSSI